MFVRPEAAAQDLVRAIGENLVHVHVERHARAGVKDIDNELVRVLSGEDLVARRDDGVLTALVETAGFAVRQCGRALDANEGSDECGKGSIAADGIVLNRARRLHAVVDVRGNVLEADGIFFLTRGGG